MGQRSRLGHPPPNFQIFPFVNILKFQTIPSQPKRNRLASNLNHECTESRSHVTVWKSPELFQYNQYSNQYNQMIHSQRICLSDNTDVCLLLSFFLYFLPNSHFLFNKPNVLVFFLAQTGFHKSTEMLWKMKDLIDVTWSSRDLQCFHVSVLHVDFIYLRPTLVSISQIHQMNETRGVGFIRRL